MPQRTDIAKISFTVAELIDLFSSDHIPSGVDETTISLWIEEKIGDRHRLGDGRIVLMFEVPKKGVSNEQRP